MQVHNTPHATNNVLWPFVNEWPHSQRNTCVYATNYYLNPSKYGPSSLTYLQSKITNSFVLKLSWYQRETKAMLPLFTTALELEHNRAPYWISTKMASDGDKNVGY